MDTQKKLITLGIVWLIFLSALIGTGSYYIGEGVRRDNTEYGMIGFLFVLAGIITIFLSLYFLSSLNGWGSTVLKKMIFTEKSRYSIKCIPLAYLEKPDGHFILALPVRDHLGIYNGEPPFLLKLPDNRSQALVGYLETIKAVGLRSREFVMLSVGAEHPEDVVIKSPNKYIFGDICEQSTMVPSTLRGLDLIDEETSKGKQVFTELPQNITIEITENLPAEPADTD